MPISIGNKAERVLRLLIGVRNPRVAAALAGYGFSEQTIQEGWDLLQALGRRPGLLGHPTQRLGRRQPRGRSAAPDRRLSRPYPLQKRDELTLQFRDHHRVG